MEKLMVMVWSEGGLPDVDALDRLGDDLAASGAVAVRYALTDSSVLVDGAPGATTRSTVEVAPIGVISVWAHSVVGARATAYIDIISDVFDRCAAYVVCESNPLRNAAGRSDLFTQVALLQRPAGLSEAQWLALWHEHTEVAIATQSTVEYRQNQVVRSVGEPWLDLAAIVEERFPTEALRDWEVFYDAVGAPERFQANVDAMIASTSRFIDLDRGLDVFLASERDAVAPPW